MRQWELSRKAAWGVAFGAMMFAATVCTATPPAVIDAWIHPDPVHHAASVFDDVEREWFKQELAKVSGPGLSLMYPPPAPFVGFRSRHELDRALIGLICPSLQRGDVQKIKTFFETINKEKLVRGRGNHDGWTLVNYQLLQENSGWWRLEARHQNVSGPSEKAAPLREQTGPSFWTYVNCADDYYQTGPK